MEQPIACVFSFDSYHPKTVSEAAVVLKEGACCPVLRTPAQIWLSQRVLNQ